jgi:hypothetical protein
MDEVDIIAVWVRFGGGGTGVWVREDGGGGKPKGGDSDLSADVSLYEDKESVAFTGLIFWVENGAVRGSDDDGAVGESGSGKTAGAEG